MKQIAIVLLISITFSACFAIPIPDSIKASVKQMDLTNNLNEKNVMSIITSLTEQKIIKNTSTLRQTFVLPDHGKTEFVKLSGKIDEFGRTAQVKLIITKPDGNLDSITSPLIETGYYSTIYPIKSNSKIGIYKVEAYFMDELKSTSYFLLTKKEISSNFPSWIITIFEWWSDDKISDLEIINSVQHLVNMGLIVISDKSTMLSIEVTGEKLVRRGTTHTINVLVTDGFQPINGAKVTLTIEDYGDNIIREFDGFTNKNGFFVFSWEIPKSFNDYETLLAYISVSGNGSSQTKLFKFQVYCLPGTANCNIDGN